MVCQAAAVSRVTRPPGSRLRSSLWIHLIGSGLWLSQVAIATAADPTGATEIFPRPLTSYAAEPGASVWEMLKERIQADPFNLVATAIFGLAIAHTFLAPAFLRWSHRFKQQHQEQLAEKMRTRPVGAREEVSFLAVLFHFLGEVEVIFGIWVVPLLMAITLDKGWPVARDYLGQGLDFTEPLFVIVIMTIAASRPVLKLAEQTMSMFAALGKGKPVAWWLSILTLGPILGSLITEPAAMTICALLLAEKFYQLQPSPKFAYATMGLLFVDVSVGGVLTPFAAPPVLMVAGKWGWGLSHMLTHFGWKAVAGVAASNLLYSLWFRREFQFLARKVADTGDGAPRITPREAAVPAWITGVHLAFLAWTVINAHFPVLFIGGFLFYLAFVQATEHHQGELGLRPALLVGFFLAGLVVHGGLQGWWIGPLLGRLSETPLFLGATLLTAFNDNAAITYLASQVPNLGPGLAYAVVAGAVAGGGLTVIANAPNPAGQSILSRFFPEGISAWRLFLGALAPTVVVASAFLLLK